MAKQEQDQKVPAAVADDDGQSTVQEKPARAAVGEAPPAAVAVQTYSTTEGYEAGNTAPSDLYVDDESGKVVTDPPEKGTLVATKGAVLTPLAVRLMADAGGAPGKS